MILTHARIGGPVRVGTIKCRSGATRRFAVCRAGSDATNRLADAIKVAEECVDNCENVMKAMEECAVEWDVVEELSAAQKDRDDDMQESELTDEQLAFLTKIRMVSDEDGKWTEIAPHIIEEIEYLYSELTETRTQNIRLKRIISSYFGRSVFSPSRFGAPDSRKKTSSMDVFDEFLEYDGPSIDNEPDNTTELYEFCGEVPYDDECRMYDV